MKNVLGFTLIELLVVVLIIGILAAIAMPKYQMAVDKARFVQAVADLDAVKKAEEIFYAANHHYADDLIDLDVDVKYTLDPTNENRHYKSADGKCYIELKEVDKVHGSNTSTRAANMSAWCYLKPPYPGNGYGERIGVFVYMDQATMGSDDNPQPIPANQRRLCLDFEGRNQTDRAKQICRSYGKEKITAVTSIAGYPM